MRKKESSEKSLELAEISVLFQKSQKGAVCCLDASGTRSDDDRKILIGLAQW
jgi:hypothetical protein